MENSASTITYYIYARKSSESEDRQVQSVDDQIDSMTGLAKARGLKIVKVLQEAKSAKKPDNRSIFSEMLDNIERGKANGILVWQINRLSRNPVDSGRIQWMLQRGLIKSIQTIDREYRPEDNVLLLSVESGMANQFIIDLRKNTLRGMESKLQKGWVPNLARLGYLNDRLNKTIVKDTERFDLVRKMWDLMLTGNYTTRQIHDVMSKWGFTTVQRKHRGGKPLSLSGLYSMFRSKFYAGIIQWNDLEYQGVHEPMITIDEYNRVQELLSRKTLKPRAKRLEHAFTGVISCGECGAFVTAETKFKTIKSTGELRRYEYYHCTGKKKYIKCSQRYVIAEGVLNEQIEKEILKITILPKFREWALEILNKSNDQEITDRTKVRETQNGALVEAQAQLDSLTKMRYRDLITDEEFVKERNSLQSIVANLRQQLTETNDRTDSYLELTEKVFDFTCYAHAKFLVGDAQTKKEILAALGSAITLKDKVLKIELNEWFVPVLTSYKNLEKQYLRSEPSKSLSRATENRPLGTVNSDWGARRESDPRSRCHRAVLYH